MEPLGHSAGSEKEPMRFHLRLGRRGLATAAAIVVTLMAPRWSSAEVITIDDGGLRGTTDIPFTCVEGTEGPLWKPSMGFVYRNVEPFELSVGDTISFDIQMRPGDPDTLGFLAQVDLALAHAPDPNNPFKPAERAGSDFTLVANGGVAASPGDRTLGNYDLTFTADAPFSFPGGGLIIRVSEPLGPLASRTFLQCLPVIVADVAPTGTNRLVGTFMQEPGEYPWRFENRLDTPGVPYVRISWTRCGDGVRSGTEECDDGNMDQMDACTSRCTIPVCGDGILSAGEPCDDGNADDTDGCTNACRIAACGDGIVAVTEECDDGNADETDDCTSTCHRPACGDGVLQANEECDNSAVVDSPDPFCNDSCHLQAFAKGSGCSAEGGVGPAAALVLLLIALRRRSARWIVALALCWTGAARAQRSAEGFRVDRFEMAPSVDDGLVVQDPRVLPNMHWSVSATLGFSNTLLRVVPTLDTDKGVDVVGTRLSAYLDAAIGFRDRFEINVSLPFAVAQASESGTAAGIMLNSAGLGAVGDARVGGSVLLVGRKRGPQLGLAATLAIPIGSENDFTGDGGVGGEVLATAGFPQPRYTILANAGVRFRPGADYVSSDQGSELIGRAGVLVPMLNQRLVSSLEFDVMARATGPDAWDALGSPILALLGARYHFPSGFRVGAGIGAGLTESPGSPAVRALLTVGYSPEPEPIKHQPPRPPPPEPPLDSDGDRIIDQLDKCPFEPEDYNGFQDDDGCPDGPPDPDAPLTLEQVVTLPSPIEFKFDTAIMLPGADRYLLQVLEILKQHPEVVRLEIQGHTSSEGGYDYNMRLSNDRAKAVYTWLTDRGVDGQRLVPRGYGLTLPLVANDSEPNRQRNRRVQFRLLEQAPGSKPIGAPLGRPQPPTTAPVTAPATGTPPAGAVPPTTTTAPKPPSAVAPPPTTPPHG